VQFFLWFGINAITPFITSYARKVIGPSDSGALLLSFILLGSTAPFNWPAGGLADRLGVKRVFQVGMIVLAGASVAGIFIRVPLALYATLLVAGIGNAAQTGSSYPLLTRLVRPDRMRLYTGLNSAITSVAAPASTLITGVLSDRFGYTAMFPFVAAMFLFSLAPLAALNV
jgi:MFS family permease